jgi:hypothetical protein
MYIRYQIGIRLDLIERYTFSSPAQHFIIDLYKEAEDYK